MYRVTKTYGHERGLSACFRQWRAKSHCAKLHGYALAFDLTFETCQLDNNGWVIDFGCLGSFKEQLEALFDHKLLVANDDPLKPDLVRLSSAAATVVLVESTGCEAFALLVAEQLAVWLVACDLSDRIRVHSVTCREHGSNSATYYPGVVQ